jgi:hypothetical protein
MERTMPNIVASAKGGDGARDRARCRLGSAGPGGAAGRPHTRPAARPRGPAAAQAWSGTVFPLDATAHPLFTPSTAGATESSTRGHDDRHRGSLQLTGLAKGPRPRCERDGEVTLGSHSVAPAPAAEGS